MESHLIVSITLFFCIFFAVTSLLQIFSKKTAMPYTVLLLLAGFLAQFLFHLLHLESEISLDPSIIYYLLLPLLLFESAMHINIHQFRLQFWTVTFMSTFGLLVSLFIVGFGIAWVLGLPLGMALLFGALISATDPIAVLSIFKSLGAPKRLALLADGESMFNDATAVIAFKVVSSFVLVGGFIESQRLFMSLGNFAYMFFGSIVLGLVLGYLCSEIIRKVKDEHLIEASITVALALGSFILSDHFLHLSGVITTVIAGIAFGNLGKTRISSNVKRFVNRTWEYVAFICVSLVFFFASFELDFNLLFGQIDKLHAVIIIVLIARAVSVYLSFFLSNTLPFFKNEPDVPLSWQHILNWGGLRGVIPLVLAYSLPDGYLYKDEIISFTLATLVFTLLINALTIRWVLVKLGLHLPKREEEIIKEEFDIFDIEGKRATLKELPKREFYDQIIKLADEKLLNEEMRHRNKLLLMANKNELMSSLKLQAIEITRQTLIQLFQKGYISEGVVYEYETQLDLRQDAIEYPEVYLGRGYMKGGRLPNRKLFRERIRSFRNLIRNFPILKPFIGQQEKDIVEERFMFLKSKIICADEVSSYLKKVKAIVEENAEATKAIKEVEAEYIESKKGYEVDIAAIKKEYPEVVKDYQLILVNNILGTYRV